MVAQTICVLLLAVGLVAARVDFSSSHVYDEFDFKGQSTVTLDCSDVCAIFASVTNVSDYLARNLLIQLPKGFMSVAEVAHRTDPISKIKSPLIVNRTAELKIVNANTQYAAGPLVLYVVNGIEAISPSAEVYEAKGLSIADVPQAVTVMSARPFTLHQEARQGEAANVPEAVMVTMSGFDGLGLTQQSWMMKCWPLYFRATGSHFSGLNLEVNGPIVTVYYDKIDFGVPLPPLTANIGIANKLNFEKSGWVGSPGAHSCEGRPLYRSSLYDMTTPIHAEILSDKPVTFWVKYSTRSEGLKLNYNGNVTSAQSTTPGLPGELQFFDAQHVGVGWKPDGSDGNYFIVQWNNTSW